MRCAFCYKPDSYEGISGWEKITVAGDEHDICDECMQLLYDKQSAVITAHMAHMEDRA